MANSIGYHTRLRSDDRIKVQGGIFGGALDMETANRLTRFFTVKVMPSGTPVFVDAEGREIRLYVTIDPATTEKGKEALREHAGGEERAREKLRAMQDEMETLLEGMSLAEALRRLKADPEATERLPAPLVPRVVPIAPPTELSPAFWKWREGLPANERNGYSTRALQQRFAEYQETLARNAGWRVAPNDVPGVVMRPATEQELSAGNGADVFAHSWKDACEIDNLA